MGGHGDVSGFAPVVNDALDQGNTCTGAVECVARVREASQRGVCPLLCLGVCGPDLGNALFEHGDLLGRRLS